jgi:hypothetical protein
VPPNSSLDQLEARIENPESTMPRLLKVKEGDLSGSSAETDSLGEMS